VPFDPSAFSGSDFLPGGDAAMHSDAEGCQCSTPRAGFAHHQLGTFGVWGTAGDWFPRVADAGFGVLGIPVGVRLDN
jgi:hypothetical protein